jgi:hypothetical protein
VRIAAPGRTKHSKHCDIFSAGPIIVLMMEALDEEHICGRIDDPMVKKVAFIRAL